jgi:nucleoside-diphosphate-sugar epimerase
MEAAARGTPYRIAFGGRTELHYAPDVARGFIAAARSNRRGAFAYDFPGTSMSIADVVETIEAAVPAAKGTITFDDVPLPFPDELPGERLPDAQLTPFRDAVHETIEHFRAAVRTA